MGREVDELQLKPSFWKSRYVLYCFTLSARVSITEMALSFPFIYLPPLSVDRQIKMNSIQRQHACRFYMFFR